MCIERAQQWISDNHYSFRSVEMNTMIRSCDVHTTFFVVWKLPERALRLIITHCMYETHVHTINIVFWKHYFVIIVKS